VFSPETRDKKSQNVNKRLKKENLPSEIVEVNVQNIGEQQTFIYTFNLFFYYVPTNNIFKIIFQEYFIKCICFESTIGK